MNNPRQRKKKIKEFVVLSMASAIARTEFPLSPSVLDELTDEEKIYASDIQGWIVRKIRRMLEVNYAPVGVPSDSLMRAIIDGSFAESLETVFRRLADEENVSAIDTHIEEP